MDLRIEGFLNWVPDKDIPESMLRSEDLRCATRGRRGKPAFDKSTAGRFWFGRREKMRSRSKTVAVGALKNPQDRNETCDYERIVRP
jgi:hypothetical protein